MGVPVVGSAIDGPYWGDPKDTNLFAAAGVTNEDYMSLAEGQFMKSQGVTKCASIGYAGSPSSALAAEGFIKSCQAAGLASGYINTQVPFGSTNVGPIALAMKNAGVDGVYLPIEPEHRVRAGGRTARARRQGEVRPAGDRVRRRPAGLQADRGGGAG